MWPFEPVTVKAYAGRVVLVHKGQVVAAHLRCRTPGGQVLDPLHFLAAVQRKPAYLDHTKLFKGLDLPPAFGRLRERLEKDLGTRTGTRHYIRVPQLLGRHTAAWVARAIEAGLHGQTVRAVFIEQLIEQQLTEQGRSDGPGDELSAGDRAEGASPPGQTPTGNCLQKISRLFAPARRCRLHWLNPDPYSLASKVTGQGGDY